MAFRLSLYQELEPLLQNHRDLYLTVLVPGGPAFEYLDDPTFPPQNSRKTLQ